MGAEVNMHPPRRMPNTRRAAASLQGGDRSALSRGHGGAALPSRPVAAERRCAIGYGSPAQNCRQEGKAQPASALSARRIPLEAP